MSSVPVESDPLSAFRAEADGPAPLTDSATLKTPAMDVRPSMAHVAAAFGVGAAIVSAIGVTVLQDWMPVRAATPELATLSIDSRPPGADVLVDGQVRGTSPLTLSLAAGDHRVAVRRGSDERGGSFALKAGATVVQYFEFVAQPSMPATARLVVVTDPPGAHVSVDGQARGSSPLTLGDVLAGEHKVSVSTEFGSAERTVRAEAGASASVVFSLPKAASPAAGWLAVSAPFDVRVMEGDALIGESRSARIMISAGSHRIALVNEALQFQETRSVELGAGKTLTIRVDPPKAVVSANARPWADVVVDGVGVGQTPIANLPMAIGQHDVVFLNPELGERRQKIVVTARGPNRIAVDMTKP
jgi:PEGA domain